MPHPAIVWRKDTSIPRMPFHRFMQACGFVFAVVVASTAMAQPLKTNPTPQDYVERNGGGAATTASPCMA